MGPQIVPHAIAKDGRTEMLFEHPQDGRALFIGQHIEHGIGIFRSPDRIFDGPGAVQPVDGKGGGARDREGIPPLPFGLPGIHRRHLHERREGFIQPEPVPPGHRHQIPEPHMGVFVGHDVGDPLHLRMRRAVPVDQQRRLAERDGPEIFHGARGEIGDRQEIQLVAGVGDPIVVLEVAQRRRRDVLPEGGEVRFARHGPEPDRGAPDQGRRGGFDPSHDEGHEIGRHLDGVRKAEHLLICLEGLGCDERVGHGRQARIDHERGGEDGLEVRLVPAGEGSSGVRGLKLGGRQVMRGAGAISVGTAVKPSQFVVEPSLEGKA